MNTNPDQKVAKIIQQKFKDGELLRDTDLSKISEKLASGMISEEDWLLMAELSLDK